MWCAYELQRRHSDLIVPVLHPGVIDTGIGEGNPRYKLSGTLSSGSLHT